MNRRCALERLHWHCSRALRFSHITIAQEKWVKDQLVGTSIYVSSTGQSMTVASCHGQFCKALRPTQQMIIEAAVKKCGAAELLRAQVATIFD